MSVFVQVWIFPKLLHLLRFAADIHSITLEGQLDTMEMVGVDSGHILNSEIYNGRPVAYMYTIFLP